MRPARPVQRENAIAQKRIEDLMSGAQRKVIELGRQDGLDIFRIDGGDLRAAQDGALKGRATAGHDLLNVLARLLSFRGPDELKEGRDAEERRWQLRRRTASVDSGQAATSKGPEDGAGEQIDDVCRQERDRQHGE